jgi:hypothetical protein
MSADGLLNQWRGKGVHVERLAEPIVRIVDKRTASEIGVDKGYSIGILPGPEGEWAKCKGAFEAK